ncbi:hypothetical protein LJC03_03430, partial [Methanobrevibacter sp. OttesenSCG-928-I08]|nr:hypothetical protein [Methanobrevibacter sp. OttesenSCG-928-I08]
MSDEIEIITDDLSFKLLSYNWRKQDNKINGPNCLFSFLQVQNGVPATITIYNFKEEAESVEEVKDSVEKNTSSQGWEIISSKVKNIGDKEVFD